MKGSILCPHCAELGRTPKVLGKYEDLRGAGDVYLWCKRCRREVRIRIESYGKKEG